MPSRPKGKGKARAELEQQLLDNGSLPNSQGSDDDGMAAILAQKIQAGMEKKRRDKETKFLATYKKETTETITRTALEFNDYCNQIDQAFEEFAQEYAKIEDEIRGIWTKIVKAHEPTIAESKQRPGEEVQLEKEREEEQVLGLAYHKKAEESMAQIISTMLRSGLDD